MLAHHVTFLTNIFSVSFWYTDICIGKRDGYSLGAQTSTNLKVCVVCVQAHVRQNFRAAFLFGGVALTLVVCSAKSAEKSTYFRKSIKTPLLDSVISDLRQRLSPEVLDLFQLGVFPPKPNITGIIVIAVGSSVQTAYNIYDSFLEDRFFSLPAFLIAIGVIIFLTSLLGFYGAFTENYYVIMAYVGAMAIIFVFQFSAMIAGYALRGNTVAIVKVKLLETMSLYNNNLDVTMLWDEMQRDFECCGVNGPDEWVERLTVEGNEESGIPVSCCPHEFGAIGQMTCTPDGATTYKVGCGEAFGEWVQGHARSIGIAGVFLVLLQLFSKRSRRTYASDTVRAWCRACVLRRTCIPPSKDACDCNLRARQQHGRRMTMLCFALRDRCDL
ncbi:CD63 antigen [Eumeta japonica]|uniref:CD63 antigen n=1 Tax=Eumeta variegata TaxID=151549 RepID=A0A4C1UJK8_EUMVA|nr:CD63 antigen [Eumeta japonica]